VTSPLPAPNLFFELPPALAYVIDSDDSLRWALDTLVHGACRRTGTCPSIRALLGRRPTFAPSCLVLDVSQLDCDDFLPGPWPFEMPVICITSKGDVALSVRAMKAGAVDVLTTPLGVAPLLEAVRTALILSEAGLSREVELNAMRRRHASLSHREREVLALVASGMLNKQVASELGISEITVKAHRGRVMRKMQARSFANLVMIADRLELTQCERLAPPSHANCEFRLNASPYFLKDVTAEYGSDFSGSESRLLGARKSAFGDSKETTHG